MPGPDAGGGQPGGELAHPAVQRAQLTVAPPTSTTAGEWSSARSVERRPELPAAARGRRPGRGGPASASSRSRDPLRDRVGVLRRVLGDQVGGALVAVQLRLRQPVAQVGEVALAEHRVARAPQQQRRDVEVADPRRRSRSTARVATGGPAENGMSATKSPTDRRRPAEAYGAASARRTSAGQRRPRQRGGGPHEDRACARRTSPRSPGTCASRISAGPWSPGGLRDRGVGEHHAAQLVAVRQRPAERDDATPVVADGDHRAGDAERRGQVPRSATRCASVRGASRPLGEAHAEVVGGDDPPAGRRRGQQAGATGRTRWGCRARTAACRPGR